MATNLDHDIATMSPRTNREGHANSFARLLSPRGWESFLRRRHAGSFVVRDHSWRSCRWLAFCALLSPWRCPLPSPGTSCLDPTVSTILSPLVQGTGAHRHASCRPTTTARRTPLFLLSSTLSPQTDRELIGRPRWPLQGQRHRPPPLSSIPPSLLFPFPARPPA